MGLTRIIPPLTTAPTILAHILTSRPISPAPHRITTKKPSRIEIRRLISHLFLHLRLPIKSQLDNHILKLDHSPSHPNEYCNPNPNWKASQRRLICRHRSFSPRCSDHTHNLAWKHPSFNPRRGDHIHNLGCKHRTSRTRRIDFTWLKSILQDILALAPRITLRGSTNKTRAALTAGKFHIRTDIKMSMMMIRMTGLMMGMESLHVVVMVGAGGMGEVEAEAVLFQYCSDEFWSCVDSDGGLGEKLFWEYYRLRSSWILESRTLSDVLSHVYLLKTHVLFAR